MRTTVKLAIAILIGIPLTAVAQESNLSCVKDITYSKEFLAKFPQAGAACNEVIQTNGQKWVRFNAEVEELQGNHLTVSFIDRHDSPVATMTFEFDPEARVTLAKNKQVKAASGVEKGDKLVVWMPENSVGFYAEPGARVSQHFALVSDDTKER